MAPSARLLARTIEFKDRLLALSDTPPFVDEVDEQLLILLGAGGPRDQSEYAYAMDGILLDHRFSSGKKLVEHFVDQNPRLSAEEREMLLSWRNARQGVFRLDAKDGGALVMYNLADDLSYRIYANAGPEFTDQVEIGWFVMTRIVPIGEDWLFSGGQIPLYPDEIDAAYQMAIKLTEAFPNIVFQNPRFLQLGWEHQRKERDGFIQFFGSDVVTMPPKHVKRRMDEYVSWRTNEYRGDDGKTVAERTKEFDGAPRRGLRFDIPSEMQKGDSIGVMYDEIDGLFLLPELGMVQEVFADPSLLSDPDHEDVMLWYLQSQDMVPLPLRLFGDRAPDQATEIFRTLLDEPDFEWNLDGEQLLRDYKDWYFRDPVWPGISPIPEALSAYQHRQSPAKQTGRNDPCPCGSGRKFKHCHDRAKR